MFSHSFINVHIDSYSHFVQKHRSCTCCVAKKQSDLNEHRTRDPIATLPILLALQSSCRVFQDFFLIITYHHFRTYQHESTDYCPNMHPFFFSEQMFSSSGVQIDFCRVCYIRYFTYGWTSFNAFTKLEAMQMHKEAHGNCHHNFTVVFVEK